MVLPCIEDGFGLVMAQALACGCPIIASEHTGARDLCTHGVEGFIVPIRSPARITQYLQQTADDGALREQMSQAALRVLHDRCKGWSVYGENMVAAVAHAIQSKSKLTNQATNDHGGLT